MVTPDTDGKLHRMKCLFKQKDIVGDWVALKCLGMLRAETTADDNEAMLNNKLIHVSKKLC